MGLGEFYSLACAVAWALAIIVFRKAGQGLSPQHLNLLKNSVMLAALTPTMWLLGSPFTLPESAFIVSIISGFIGIAVGDGLYLRAVQMLGASRAGLAGMLYSPWVVLLSGIWLGESLASGQWAGLGLVLFGLLGVGLVQRHSIGAIEHGQFSWGGLLIAGAAMALMAAGVVLVKPALEQESFLTVVWYRAMAGTLPLLFWLERPGTQSHLRLWSAQAWVGVERWGLLLVGCFLGTYVAMLLWLAGYRYTQASVAAVLNESAALWIMLFAWWFLGDTLNRRQLACAGLIAVGVLLVLFA